MMHEVRLDLLSVGAGAVTAHDLARAYLAALASACGREVLSCEPQFATEDHWDDYEDPREDEIYRWGNSDYGLQARTAGQGDYSRPCGIIPFNMTSTI